MIRFAGGTGACRAADPDRGISRPHPLLAQHGGHVAVDAAADQKLIVVQPAANGRLRVNSSVTTERTIVSINCSGLRCE